MPIIPRLAHREPVLRNRCGCPPVSASRRMTAAAVLGWLGGCATIPGLPTSSAADEVKVETTRPAARVMLLPTCPGEAPAELVPVALAAALIPIAADAAVS